MSAGYPKCNKTDCFANILYGRCSLLTHRCESPVCPFYKTREQAEIDKQKAHEKLVNEDKFDLIDKYEYNKQRRGQW